MIYYLYLLKCQQYFKIGIANDISRRMCEMQVGNPFPISREASLCFASKDAALTAEKSLHGLFSKSAVSGEWFDLGDDASFVFYDGVCQILTKPQRAVAANILLSVETHLKNPQSKGLNVILMAKDGTLYTAIQWEGHALDEDNGLILADGKPVLEV